jgi:hypothetical protein
LIFFEGIAENCFFRYLMEVFPPEPGVTVQFAQIDGGSLERYYNAWRTMYSGQNSIFFLFDGDLHQLGAKELPEDAEKRYLADIFRKLGVRVVEKRPKGVAAGAGEGRVLERAFVGSCHLYPCLEALLLRLLEVKPAAVSQRCKSRFRGEARNAFGKKKGLAVQDVSMSQWKELLPPGQLKAKKDSIPELKKIAGFLESATIPI